mgnify:CR=1 FL=1
MGEGDRDSLREFHVKCQRKPRSLMKNSIDAQVEFSFKGENYSLSSTLDLDQLLAQHDSLPDIHAFLAKEHDIDTYSYLYEVMQEAEIEFENAQGIAADFLSDGNFNQTEYTTAWRGNSVLALLQPIATRELGIADLKQHQGLKNALLQAYNLGKQK